MAQIRLLHAVHLPLRSAGQITAALHSARLARERAQDSSTLLLFCDLPDADAQVLPQDAALLRCMQSCAMNTASHPTGELLFLVRRRSYDAASRTWLGEHQAIGVRQTLHALLRGYPIVPLEQANFSSESLRDAFDAVLITNAALHTTPDTPARMLAQLQCSSCSALRGKVIVPYHREEPLFNRLYRLGFSLPPQLPGSAYVQEEPLAAIYAPDALIKPPPEDMARDCYFLLHAAPTFGDCFLRAALFYPWHSSRLFLLPIAQVLLLFLSGLAGWPFLAMLTIALPELRALVHPRQLPCALVRIAFLPRHALTSMDARIRKHFAESKLQPSLHAGSGTCVLFGAALLVLALRSAGALVVLFAVSLLWLCAPMLERALALPARERIPLDKDEQRQLRVLAEGAFFALSPEAASPAHLLAACLGCELELIEPDEAARRADGMLPQLSPACAFDCACILAAAQYFKERMAEYDAALRELPAKLDALACAQPIRREGGLLASLLRIAHDHTPTQDALNMLKSAGDDQAMDTLFLPREYLMESESLLPMTHPHTFLRQLRLSPVNTGKTEKNDPPPPTEEANRFLVLACAALNAPIHSLFLRSGRIAPYAPLLDIL